MKVDRHRLQASEQRITLVEVTPSRLCKGDGGVVEGAHDPAQKIRRRHEVGVEDCDVWRMRLRESGGQRARFEAGSGTASHMGDVDLLSAPVRRTLGDDLCRLVIRVVENLDFEAAVRPVHCADRVDDALRDVSLIEDGDLDAYVRFVGHDRADQG